MNLPHSLRLPGWLMLGAACLAGGALTGRAAETGRLISRVFLPEDYRGESQMSDVVQTPDGLIYGATLGAVHEFDGAAWRVIPVPTSWIMDLDVDAAGRVGVTGEDEFGLLEPDADGIRRYRSLVSQVPAALRPLGRIWTVFAFEGAFYWGTDNVVLRWRDGVMHTWPFPDTDARRALYRGGKHLYLATTDQGLSRLEGDTWQPVSGDEQFKKLPIALLDDWVAPGLLFTSKEGGLWRLDAAGTVARVPSNLPAAVAAVEGARLVDTIRLRDGRLAVLTKNAGVFLVNQQGDVDLSFGTTGGVSSLNLFSAAQDREGGLWVGTARGAFRVELDPSLTVFDQENGAPPGGMYAIARYQGRLYACGQDGLYRFSSDTSGNQGRFERVPDAEGFMPYDLLTHRSGLVVVGDAGLFRYADGVMSHDFDAPHSLNTVAVSKTDPDRVFVGGIGFVHTLRWDGTAWRDEGAIAAVKEDARTIVEDEQGVMWIGTPSRGILRVRRPAGVTTWQTAQADLFDTTRGLPAGHDWLSAYESPVGPLFTHAKGVSAYDPSVDRLVPARALTEAGVGGRYTYPLAAGKGQAMWMQFGYPPAGETPVIGGLLPAPGGGWTWRELPAGVYPALGFLGAGELIWEASDGGEGVLWIQGQQSIVRCELDGALVHRGAAAPGVVMRTVTRGDQLLPVAPSGETPLLFTRAPLRLRFASPVYAPGGTIEYQYRMTGYDDRWSSWTTASEAVFTNLSAGAYAFEARARRGGGEPGPATHWRFLVKPRWWQSVPAVLAGLAALMLGFWAIVRWRVGRVERERARLETIVRQRTVELSRERDRADAANRAKTMFLASMSHELRTPLHAILGYSQLLGGDPSVPASARQRLQIVAGSGQHLLRLINEVLDLSKIESGQIEVRHDPFDLRALLEEVASTHESRAVARGIAFHRPDVTGLPGMVIGDPQKFRQVLDNLVGNAVKFTRTGEVRVRASLVSPERMRVEVTDTGPGIAPEDLARLFEPFVQAERGTAASAQGTGLGLVIARRLATLMGGEVQVESVVGRGSRFWFELPLRVAPTRTAAAVPVLQPIGYEGPRRTILAVDDTEENRLLFRDLLAPLGFEVVLAGSADEALASLDRVKPDLVLLDLRMPGTSGFALARILRADPRSQGAKILAASASVFGHDPTEALAAGCDAFISKPFLPAEFFGRVAELLGLTWREAPPAESAGAAPIEPELLASIREAARLGDVVALREFLERLRARHPHAPLLGAISAAVDAFDTDRIVQLLDPGSSGQPA